MKANGYLTKISSALTSIFVIEVVMKMVAYTPRGYLVSFRLI